MNIFQKYKQGSIEKLQIICFYNGSRGQFRCIFLELLYFNFLIIQDSYNLDANVTYFFFIMARNLDIGLGTTPSRGDEYSDISRFNQMVTLNFPSLIAIGC